MKYSRENELALHYHDYRFMMDFLLKQKLEPDVRAMFMSLEAHIQENLYKLLTDSEMGFVRRYFEHHYRADETSVQEKATPF